MNELYGTISSSGSLTGNIEIGNIEISIQSNKNVIPSFSEQIIIPDSTYNCLAQITVGAIPITEIENSSGGLTLTIGV